MTDKLICTWLRLPPDGWPPDHYRLLGLDPGESDVNMIERHVQERLETVRRYQLIHPELITEAMNRLAQAFVCLADPESKKAYDATLLQRSAARPPQSHSPAGPAAAVRTDQTRTTQLDFAAPTGALTHSDGDTQLDSAPPAVLSPADAISQAPAGPEKVDPVVERARSSAPARRGLGTKRTRCRRLVRTRQLLRAWEQVGKYVGDPTRRMTRSAKATELIQALTTIRTLLRNSSPLLEVASQPGWLVIALACRQVIVPTFQTLLPSEREALARDWKAGHQLLSKEFLRQKRRAMREPNVMGRAVRAVKTFVANEPGMVLLLLALIALNVALWRQHLTTNRLKFPGAAAGGQLREVFDRRLAPGAPCIGYLSAKGLRFAPATQGDEAAYRALH